MDIIKCVIRGQKLSVNIPFMVDLTINYFNVSADFDSEWDDYQQRWVYITKHDDSSVGGSFLLNEDNKVPDTSSINLNGGQWDIWFLGVSGDRYGVTSRITTEVKTFKVTESGQYEAVMPTIPQSNVEQVTALAMDAFNDSQYAKVTADEAKEIAEVVMEMAESGELDGATFTPSVSSAGVISWTNNKHLPNPTPVNIKGQKGDKGDPGEVTQAEFDELAEEVAQQKNDVGDKAGMLVEMPSGSIASFFPDATIPNLLNVSVDIKPVQTGTGDPSPSNVRPISGWSSIPINVKGKNLLPFPYADESQTKNGLTFTVNSNGSITVNGTATANTTFNLSAAASATALDFLPTGDYIINGAPAGSSPSTYNIQTRINGTWIEVYDSRTVHYVHGGEGQSVCRLRVLADVTVDNITFWPMIRSASDSDPTYKSYSEDNEVYNIALGQTVYRGTLDVTNGTLTILGPKNKLSDITGWTYNANGYFSSGNVQASQFFVTDCDTYAVVDWTIPAASRPDYSINTGASSQAQRKLYVRDSTFTTVEDFLAARGNAEIVYTLVAPIVIQLDPVTIATITEQTNSVWTDAGNVTVKCATDIKAYINRLSQPTEDDMIANTLIAANKYFTINNKLYLSTTSIAVGAQIIPGTNCTETSLVEALNALNA